MEHSTLKFANITSVPAYTGLDCGEEMCEHLMSLNADKLFFVTDATVDKLHGDYFDSLKEQEAGPQVHKYIVPCGDACKSWDVMSALIEWLFASQATKRSVLVTFGGGAAINVGALVASMVFRGIKYVSIPTTLLAMHDVVTSLKTSICFQGRKNNIGTYYAPVMTLLDVGFCRTLPAAELFSGLGELAKNAAFFGGDHADGFVEALTKSSPPKRKADGSESAFSLDDDALVKLVKLGIKAKMDVLADDAYEKKFGMVFEYGHTVSHSIEKAYGDGTIPHGLGVTYGMLACSSFSERLGFMNAEDRKVHDDMCNLLVSRWPLPEPRPTANRILELSMRDSKRGITGEQPNEIAEVLLHSVGNAVQTPSMLSKFDKTLYWDWLVGMGFPVEN
jgi:3-dehydroquinate synthase/2-deoxy-scyllo-inosose synthase